MKRRHGEKIWNLNKSKDSILRYFKMTNSSIKVVSIKTKHNKKIFPRVKFPHKVTLCSRVLWILSKISWLRKISLKVK